MVARFTIRNALGLDYLGPYFDNTMFFFGGIVVQALHFTGLDEHLSSRIF